MLRNANPSFFRVCVLFAACGLILAPDLTAAQPGLTAAQPGLTAAQAGASNPFNVEQDRLAAAAERGGRRAEGVLPLLELWENWNWSTPSRSLAHLERLATSRRLSPPRRALAGALLARARLRVGDLEGSAAKTQELGYITTWRVIGSFDNEGKAGFDQAFGPERGRLEPPTMAEEFEGRERPVTWRLYPAETSRFGYINFDAIFRPYQNVCAYAETFVEVETAQPLTLWLGAGGASKLWWNGREVLADDRYRQPFPDRSAVTVPAALLCRQTL